jgi:hypothetical protein
MRNEVFVPNPRGPLNRGPHVVNVTGNAYNGQPVSGHFTFVVAY